MRVIFRAIFFYFDDKVNNFDEKDFDWKDIINGIGKQKKKVEKLVGV